MLGTALAIGPYLHYRLWVRQDGPSRDRGQQGEHEELLLPKGQVGSGVTVQQLPSVLD